MIVLDTHALIWWVNNDEAQLSDNAVLAIADGLKGDGVRASVISAWEIAMLIKKDKLELSLDLVDWLRLAEQVDRFAFVPLDVRVAVESQALPEGFHPDPADRIVVALARHLQAPLVTADRRIREYPHVHTIW